MVRAFISLTYLFSLLLGTPTNILSFLYFYRTRALPSSLLHSLMNLTDLVICLLVCPLPAVTNILSTDLTSFNWQPICYIWYTLQMVAIRYSVFLIGVVSVVRTYSIVRPLAGGLKRRYLAFILPSYIIYMIGRLAIFVMYDLKPGYYHPMRVCLILITDPNNAVHIFAWMISDFVEMLAPMAIILISCTLTVLHLKRTGINQHSDRKRRATITVLILTVIYIVFNLPYCIDRILVFITQFSRGKISPYANLYLNRPAIYFGVKSTIINLQFMGAISSVINPIVIIIRVNMIRKFRESKRKPTIIQNRSSQTRNIETQDL